MKHRLEKISKSVIDKIFEEKSINYFIIFYCSYMILCPPYFTRYLDVSIKTPFRLISVFFILIIYFFYVIYKKRISKFFVCVFITCLYFFIVCIINKNDYYYALYSNFLLSLSSVALFEIYMNSNLKKTFILINYFYWMTSILIFICVYVFGGYEALMDMYNRNNYIIFMIIYILFERNLLLVDSNKIYKIISYIMSITMIVFSMMTGALTSSIILIIIYGYIYFLDKLEIYKKVFDGFSIYFFLLVLFFFLIIFPGTHSPFVDFISRLFNKKDGLSYRSLWYDRDRELFFKKPFFGYGSMQNYAALLGQTFGSIKNNPHDFVFQYLLDGGIFGLLLLINCYRILIDSIKRKLDKSLICFLMMILFAFTLRNFLEAIGLNYIFFIFSSIYFMYITFDEDFIYFNRW